jgi:hypothetical protein
MSIIDCFLRSWLRGNRYRWSWLRRRLFERRYLGTTLPVVNSLEDIESCLRQVTWTQDGLLHLYDSISYPQVTWAKKKDDCDGFAILAAELLHRSKPNSNPVLITALGRPVKYSHTVCAFTSPHNTLWYYDCQYLRRGEWQAYGDIVSEANERIQRLVCWDVVNPMTLDTIEFHRV